MNVLLDFANDAAGFALLPIQSSLNISFQTIPRISAMMQCLLPQAFFLVAGCGALGGPLAPLQEQKLRCVRYVTMCPHQPRPSAQAKTVGQTFKSLYRILFLFMSKVFAWALSNILIHIKILFTSGIAISSKTLSSAAMCVFQQNYARERTSISVFFSRFKMS